MPAPDHDDITWPPHYTNDDGKIHQWTDVVPDDPDFDPPPVPGETPMTYRDLAVELASAQGVGLEEWFETTGQMVDPDDVDLDEDGWGGLLWMHA